MVSLQGLTEGNVVVVVVVQEESIAHTKMTATIAGEAPLNPNPLRTKKRLEKFQKLRGIVLQYNRIPTKDYVNMLCSHFNDV